MVRAVLAGALALVLAAPAGAATLCVGPAPCEYQMLGPALDAALAGDVVEVRAASDSGPWTSSKELEILGASGTVLDGGLELTHARSRVAGITLKGTLRVAGRARRMRVEGDVVLLDDAAEERPALLSSRVLGGGVVLGGGTGLLDSVEIRPATGDGVRSECAELLARHLTVVPEGEAGAGVRAQCAEGSSTVRLSDSVVWGFEAERRMIGNVQVDERSLVRGEAPGFTSATDLSPALGSPLLDAADPEPLPTGDSVALEDSAGLARAADGDGDGVVRRDVGAHERPAAVVGLPDGNLLRNPGAELGAEGWTGPFVVASYGDRFLPSLETGAALGAGQRFFSGGYDHASARAAQVVSLASAAPEIDGGVGKVTLSALVGGYRADQDEAVVTATFLDPQGHPLGVLALPPVTPAQRGQAVTLLPRSATGAVPRLTRSVEVSLGGTRVGAGSYTDTYFDNVSLVADIPGLPPPPPGTGGGDPGGPVQPPPGLRPFAGVTVLSSSATVDGRGRAQLRLGCATATVGHCTGVVTLTTVARPGRPAERLGSARFWMTPGRVLRVGIRVPKAVRRTLRSRRHLRVRLYAAARDGQGQARATTSPLRLKVPVRR